MTRVRLFVLIGRRVRWGGVALPGVGGKVTGPCERQGRKSRAEVKCELVPAAGLRCGGRGRLVVGLRLGVVPGPVPPSLRQPYGYSPPPGMSTPPRHLPRSKRRLVMGGVDIPGVGL